MRRELEDRLEQRGGGGGGGERERERQNDAMRGEREVYQGNRRERGKKNKERQNMTME